MNYKKTAFITSTGRTGTWFLTKLINEEVKNAWSGHEEQPHFKREGYKLLSRKPNLFEKLYFSIPRKYRHYKRSEKWHIETNYHLYASIHLIREVYKVPLIIHIIRDGREVVRSWLNKYRYINNDHVLPFHVPGDSAQEKWDQWSPLQKLSWFWVHVNRTAIKSQPDVIVHYEDIFFNENKGMFQILDNLEGINYKKNRVKEYFNKKVNKNKNDFFPAYEEWPDHWKKQFYDIAGEMMEEQGYSTYS